MFDFGCKNYYIEGFVAFFSYFCGELTRHGRLACHLFSLQLMAKHAVQHRVFDLSITLLLIATITTLRSIYFPSGDETIPNVATPIGAWLQQLQSMIPTFSALIWGAFIMMAGMMVGRFGARYSIYPAYTLMAIPIFGAVASCIMISKDYLLSMCAALVMLLATKYIHRCVMRSKSFSDLSLSMLAFGILPLIYAPTAILLVVLPVIIFLVRNTWRDLVVTLASLLLPTAALCYWSWCAGNGFLTPAENIYETLLTPSEFSLFSTLNPASVLLLGVILLMILCSISLIISDKYSLKVKSRAIMRFNSLLLIATLSMLLMPSSTATTFAIIATPAAMLIPLIFVRLGVGFTEILYRVMLLLAALNCVALAIF